jgi:hypothetical protein
MTTTTDILPLAAWQRTGVLLIDGFLLPSALREVQRWVDEIEAWPAGAGAWLQHDELTDAGPRRARTENFVPYHDGMRGLLTGSPMIEMASRLLGEPAVLFKEKINYKHPGGAGFAPHQDQTAYPQISRSVTCLVAVDEQTPDNGCLEFALGHHGAPIPPDADGCLPEPMARTLPWTAMPAPAGSLVWFHCYLPHRSGSNRTARSRRAIYVTYNPRSEGDLREAYYADKEARLAALGSTPGGAGRISLIGHFQGRPAPAGQDPR